MSGKQSVRLPIARRSNKRGIAACERNLHAMLCQPSSRKPVRRHAGSSRRSPQQSNVSGRACARHAWRYELRASTGAGYGG
jgi:hypothetical protein